MIIPTLIPITKKDKLSSNLLFYPFFLFLLLLPGLICIYQSFENYNLNYSNYNRIFFLLNKSLLLQFSSCPFFWILSSKTQVFLPSWLPSRFITLHFYPNLLLPSSLPFFFHDFFLQSNLNLFPNKKSPNQQIVYF